MAGLKVFAKAICGLFVAFIFLNAFSYFYFYIPKVKNADGATAIANESDHLWCYGYEGFSFGKTNNEGYNNLLDYVGQKVDVLIIGSSHMESLQIPMQQNAAAVYNRINDSGKYAYNIGVQSYTFVKNCSTFETAIRRYRPEVAVFEINDLYETKNNLKKLNEGKLNAKNKEQPLVDFLYSFPFIRASIMQYLVLKRNGHTEAEHHYNYQEELEIALNNLNTIAKENDCRLILIYHPHLSLLENGGADIVVKKEELEIFESACLKAEIEFVNMGEDFLNAYYEKKVVPHGFFNTILETGHMNADGHLLFAEKMNELIK